MNTDKLMELERKWRERGKEYLDCQYPSPWRIERALVLDACADELAAALRAEQAVGEEQRARELLAEELRREGMHEDAYPVGCGGELTPYAQAVIRAIRRALGTARQSEVVVPEKVRLAVTMLDIGQSFALCNHAHEDTRRDIKKLRPEIDCIKAWVDSLAAAPGGEGEG